MCITTTVNTTHIPSASLWRQSHGRQARLQECPVGAMSPSLHGCTVAVVGRVVLRGGSGAAMHGLWPEWTTPGRDSRWTVLLNTAWVPPLHCRRGPSRRATDLDGFWACMVCSAEHSGIGYRNGRQPADPDDGTLLRTLPVLLHPTVKADPQDGPSASMGFWPGWFVLPTIQALDDAKRRTGSRGVRIRTSGVHHISAFKSRTCCHVALKTC